MTWVIFVGMIWGAAPTCIARVAAQQVLDSLRPMTVQDLFTVQELGDVAVTADGSAIALVVRRPRSLHEPVLSWDSHEREEVWIRPLSATGNSPVIPQARLGHYDSPVWSPSGKRLALLSTRGGKQQLYLWGAKAVEPTRLAEEEVDLNVQFVIDGIRRGPVAWLDERRLICLLLPPQDPHTVGYLSSRLFLRDASITQRSPGPTASVLDTQRPMVPQQETLTIIEVASGRVDAVTVTQPFALTPLPNQGRFINVDPTRRFAAWIVETGEVRRKPDTPVDFSNAMGPLRLGLSALDRPDSVHWLGAVLPTFGRPGQAYPSTRVGEWSPAGRRFAFVGADTATPGTNRAFLVEPGLEKPTPISLSAWRVMDIHWADEDELAVQVESEDTRRSFDWWRVNLTRSIPVNLTGAMPVPPPVLVPTSSGDFLGIAAGALWQVRARAGQIKRLTTSPSSSLVSFAPITVPTAARVRWSGIVTAGEGRERTLFLTTISDKAVQLREIVRPIPEADLLAYSADARLAVFSSGEADVGPIVWSGTGETSAFTSVISLNEHLRNVQRGERRWISYVSTAGGTLKALLLLPSTPQPRNGYPLVAWVYGGFTWGDTLYLGPGAYLKVTGGNTYSLQLLAARGYAVLLPSLPLGPMGEGARGEPFSAMLQGLLPAVDKTIELGIGDPDRLAVMGHSFGGYSTYAIITQTNRFKAAIAMAGPTDLVSFYGTLYPPRRYSGAAHQDHYASLLLETGMHRLGTSLFADPDRYIRNSPLFYVDRVQTPLLIIHGDLDGVSIGQAEEFFSALHRLGKPARFVRYWWEGHGIEAPANVVHMWNEIFGWLDDHLRRREGADQPLPHNRNSDTGSGG
jgi:dipeptidyl aminopeptidase/acylaminoacyl peptidase